MAFSIASDATRPMWSSAGWDFSSVDMMRRHVLQSSTFAEWANGPVVGHLRRAWSAIDDRGSLLGLRRSDINEVCLVPACQQVAHADDAQEVDSVDGVGAHRVYGTPDLRPAADQRMLGVLITPRTL